MIFSISFFVIVTISLLLVDMYIQKQNHVIFILATISFWSLSSMVLEQVFPKVIQLDGFLPIALPLAGLLIGAVVFNVLSFHEDTYPEVVIKMRLWIKFAIPTFILFFCWLCLTGEVFFGWNMPFCQMTLVTENGPQVVWFGEMYNEIQTVKIMIGGAMVLTVLTGIEWILYNEFKNSKDFNERIRKNLDRGISPN